MKNNYLFVIVFFVGMIFAAYCYTNWKDEIRYNRLVAEGKMPEAYMKELAGDLEAAAEGYELLIRESNGTDKLSYYNMGNVSVKMALSLRNAKLLEIAVEYYKTALRIDPEFMEAKYNLEIVLRLLKKYEQQSGSGENDKEGESNNKNRGPGGSYTPFKPSDI